MLAELRSGGAAALATSGDDTVTTASVKDLWENMNSRYHHDSINLISEQTELTRKIIGLMNKIGLLFISGYPLSLLFVILIDSTQGSSQKKFMQVTASVIKTIGPSFSKYILIKTDDGNLEAAARMSGCVVQSLIRANLG